MNSIRQSHENLTLIGMPASGKSTCGKRLASKLNWNYIDLDVLMEDSQQVPLKQIRQQMSIEEFLEFEASFALQVTGSKQIISPGGSLVYSKAAMEHLRSIGKIVGLIVDPQILLQRIPDLKARGVVIRPEQTFFDVAQERHQLIEQYADAVLQTDDWTIEQTVDTIHSWLIEQLSL